MVVAGGFVAKGMMSGEGTLCSCIEHLSCEAGVVRLLCCQERLLGNCCGHVESCLFYFDLFAPDAAVVGVNKLYVEPRRTASFLPKLRRD